MKTVDMSGMGNGYEMACQKMLSNGLKAIKEKGPQWTKRAFEQLGFYENIYGIVDTAESKELLKLIANVQGGPTGAMVQCVLGHLIQIHLHGRDAWLAHFTDDRIFEIDEKVFEEKIEPFAESENCLPFRDEIASASPSEKIPIAPDPNPA